MKRSGWNIFFAAVVFSSLPALAAPDLPSPPDWSDFRPVQESDYGKLVCSISFFTQVNLGYKDLAESCALRAGYPLSMQEAALSKQRLMGRKVFRRTEMRVKDAGNCLEVRFWLVPLTFAAETRFSGNRGLTERKLQRLAAVRPDLPLEDGVLEAAAQRIRSGYRESGFRHAQVSVEIDPIESAPYQARVTFNIDEGYRSRLAGIVLWGDLPPEPENLSGELNKQFAGRIASAASRKKVRQAILSALRRRGYLRASVDEGVVDEDPLGGDLRFTFGVTARQPIRIVFEGSTLFTKAELLDTVKLNKRMIPFSPNVIRTLRREIRKLYQEHGRYFTKVRSSRRDSPDGVTEYTVRIREGQEYRLTKVHFEGNQEVKSRVLRRLVDSRPAGFWLLRRWKPGFAVRERLESDAAAIRTYYEDEGYLGTVVRYVIAPDPQNRTLVLTYHIEEGVRGVVTSVEIIWQSGTDSPASSVLREAALHLKAGDPLRLKVLQDERARMREALLGRGYPNAAVELEVNRAKGAVRYIVTPGQLVHIGQVLIQGNTDTRDYVIRRELNFKSGDLWNTNALETSEDAVNSLRFFRTVRIGPDDGTLDSPVEDVSVYVREQDTASLQLSGELNTEDGLHAGAELAQRNLFGSGAALIAGFDSYFRTGDHLFDALNGRVALARPRLFGTKVDVSAEVFAQSAIEWVEVYSYDRVGADFISRFDLLEIFKGRFGYKIADERLYDVAPDAVIGPQDSGTTVYGMLHGELDFDRRDNPFNPRHGHRSLMELSLAADELGSQADLAGAAVEQTIYLPLSDELTWANNANFRIIEPYGSTDVVPLGQRLFLGGRSSLRGFSRNVIGPRGEELSIVGGDASLNISTELQRAFTPDIVGLVFLDMGQAILRHKGDFAGDPLTFGDLRFSPGFGIHYLTPIGPISAEAGFALDREYGERWGRIYIGIGNAF